MPVRRGTKVVSCTTQSCASCLACCALCHAAGVVCMPCSGTMCVVVACCDVCHCISCRNAKKSSDLGELAEYLTQVTKGAGLAAVGTAWSLGIRSCTLLQICVVQVAVAWRQMTACCVLCRYTTRPCCTHAVSVFVCIAVVADNIIAAAACQVGETMTSFERRLWSLARDYHLLAQRQPRMLVDVARVVEMQEQVRTIQCFYNCSVYYMHCTTNSQQTW